MAKSIRSKHRRKMRNIKRQKFAAKELVKLKATVMKDILNKDSEGAVEEICTVKTASELRVNAEEKKQNDIEMEVESGSAQNFDKKTKKNEHGQYPTWMNQRAIRKQRRKNTIKKKRDTKKKTSKQVPL